MDEELIYRDEVVALLFNLSSILRTLERIEMLLEDVDGEEGEEF